MRGNLSRLCLKSVTCLFSVNCKVLVGALLLRLNGLAFGDPHGSSARPKASFVPVLAHFGLVLAAGIYYRITTVEWAILALTIGFVFSAEMINTVAELAVDMLTQQYHPMAKIAKDVGAGAVHDVADLGGLESLLDKNIAGGLNQPEPGIRRLINLCRAHCLSTKIKNMFKTYVSNNRFNFK